MSDLSNIVTEFNAIQAKFRADVQAKLSVAFNEFFVKYPEFASIEWVQYTPYFNDGDECTFSVDDFHYTAQPGWYNEETADKIVNRDYRIWELEGYTPFNAPSDYVRQSKYHTERVAAWDALSDEMKARATVLDDAWEDFTDTLRGIPDDIFEATFGNHKQVRVTRDGMEITKYDHD